MSICYFFLNPSSSNSTVLFQFKKEMQKVKKKSGAHSSEKHILTL